MFGDERQDYAAALKRNYEAGPPADWAEQHITSYASVHPWEDWAETWAHYLHMTDTLETARAYGLALRPQPVSEARRQPALRVARPAAALLPRPPEAAASETARPPAARD